MQRVRRLTSIGVVAAIGAIALTGCRSEPSVAAYVEDQRITEKQVTAIVDDAGDKIDPNAQAAPPSRSAVVSVLVLARVCQRLAADQGHPAGNQVPAEAVAQQFGLPADAAYIEETAKLYTCLAGVPLPPPTAPTAAELADVIARGKAAGAFPPNVPDKEIAARLDDAQLRGALANRKAIADAVGRYDVTVNPRYRPLEFPLLSFQGDAAAVSVPLGETGSDAVVDVR